MREKRVQVACYHALRSIRGIWNTPSWSPLRATQCISARTFLNRSESVSDRQWPCAPHPKFTRSTWMYGEADEGGASELRSQCLDAWDSLLKGRVQFVRDQFKRLELE